MYEIINIDTKLIHYPFSKLFSIQCHCQKSAIISIASYLMTTFRSYCVASHFARLSAKDSSFNISS